MNFKKIVSIFVFLLIITAPIISLADDFIEEDDSFYLEDTEIEVSSDLSEEPSINARHAVIYDRASKTVLFGKGENETCKMASTTKIMTAIVVIENCDNLDDIVVVSQKAARNRWFQIGVIYK